MLKAFSQQCAVKMLAKCSRASTLLVRMLTLFRQIELLQRRVAELENERYQHRMAGVSEKDDQRDTALDAVIFDTTFADITRPDPAQQLEDRDGQLPSSHPSPETEISCPPDIYNHSFEDPGEQLSPQTNINVSELSMDPVVRVTLLTRMHDADRRFQTESSASVDGMGAIAETRVNAANSGASDLGFFGRSSTVNFVNQVEKILNFSATEELAGTTMPWACTSQQRYQ